MEHLDCALRVWAKNNPTERTAMVALFGIDPGEEQRAWWSSRLPSSAHHALQRLAANEGLMAVVKRAREDTARAHGIEAEQCSAHLSWWVHPAQEGPPGWIIVVRHVVPHATIQTLLRHTYPSLSEVEACCTAA